MHAQIRQLADAELARLHDRLPDLSEHQRAETAATVHRILRKVLHRPTVRAKEFSSGPKGRSTSTPCNNSSTSGRPRPRHELPAPPSLRLVLRLGTRGSPLALAQAGWIARQLREQCGRPAVLVTVATPGDESTAPIERLGTTGVFTTTLREALLRGTVDLVVHSGKDLPTAPVPGCRWRRSRPVRTRATR